MGIQSTLNAIFVLMLGQVALLTLIAVILVKNRPIATAVIQP